MRAAVLRQGKVDIDELRATVAQLAGQVRALQDQAEIMQLVAQYGPPLDGTPEHREMLAPDKHRVGPQ
jgi:hypothetical protein